MQYRGVTVAAAPSILSLESPIEPDTSQPDLPQCALFQILHVSKSNKDNLSHVISSFCAYGWYPEIPSSDHIESANG